MNVETVFSLVNTVVMPLEPISLLLYWMIQKTAMTRTT